MQAENIRWMNECAQVGKGMDVIIVSTDCPYQEEQCQRHLEALLGDFIRPTAKVVAVCEDWPGGAGNGLGTLYAYQKAQIKLLQRYGVDLMELQKKGGSIAIYHTAGQGKRLSPLTGSERNNKSAVKLPAYLGKQKNFMTLLDAVLKQTAPLAQSRKGRLSVFWTDQVFIPSKVLNDPPAHHVEVFVKKTPWPDLQTFENMHFEQYGIAFFDSDKQASLFEKPSYALLESLKQTGCLARQMGKSLGCFSLSAPLTVALIDLFKEELREKKGKLDTDSSFWMAASLPKEIYLKSLPNPSAEHQARMEAFAERFCADNRSLPFFGVVDIGKDAFWWDYGTAANYFYNALKAVELTPEGEAMRAFLGLRLDPETESVCLNSTLSGSSFRRSVIVGSKCDQFKGEKCVFINSDIGTGQGESALLYNVHEKEALDLSPGTMRADAFIDERHIKLRTTLERDGKADWSEHLPHNALSYEEVYQLNRPLA